MMAAPATLNRYPGHHVLRLRVFTTVHRETVLRSELRMLRLFLSNGCTDGTQPVVQAPRV